MDKDQTPTLLPSDLRSTLINIQSLHSPQLMIEIFPNLSRRQYLKQTMILKGLQCLTLRLTTAWPFVFLPPGNMGQMCGGFGLLFRLIACAYFLLVVVIIMKLHGGTFESQFESNKDDWMLRNETLNVARNFSQFVYVNTTLIVFPEKENIHDGPGENGTLVELPKKLLSKETQNKSEMNQKFHGFNTFISDIVSLHRRVPDMRPQVCKDKVYPDNLPPAGVVIIFRDEWHSILLRTAYSVLEHSPPELVKEVIFVDDGSVDEDLKVIIGVHVAAVDKFRLVSNAKPLGLMMARQAGIEAVTADYFIVMDGHMEVGPGWLEPLINRLVEEPNACLCSHVGAILGDNLLYRVDEPSNLNFDSQFPFFDPLTLDQQWVYYKESYRKYRNHSVEPIEYGTIQGMMAAMRKDFFMQLGGFDPGMKVWGTEQMELSIKVWLCGGRVEMIPCSKVAHMYRSTPWTKHKNISSDWGAANKRRTVDVWMDEPYRSFVMEYLRHSKYDTGELSDRHRIRRDNNCKPYQHFIDKVKELSDVFFPTYVKARRAVFNRDKNRCLDIARHHNSTDNTEKIELLLYSCHKNANQNLILTDADQIRSVSCMLITTKLNGNSTEVNVIKSPANIYGKESYWDYREDDTIFNRASGLCLTALTSGTVGLRTCSATPSQVWMWERVTQ